MSTKQFKEFISSVFSPVSHLGRKFRRFLKRISKAVRRELLLISRRAKRAGAGFVLPTVTMVMLVVVLLTLSIAFRSFERVNQARNVKINQSLLSASTPALDRAKAKLDKLLEDQTKTPSDGALLTDLQKIEYKLPGEDVVRISFDMDGASGIKPKGADDDISTVDDNESFTTAWRFPIDTDGNGKYDTYNLYGIFLRNPNPDNKGAMRERKPLDARTPPFSTTTSTNKTCQALANSILVGGSGWYLSDAKLKKSFFVYAVNVPITETGLGANYETFKGNTGTTALEFQQDWTRTLPTTNAVVYQDDLVIAPGASFNLNGRIVASSNLMLAPNKDNEFTSYLISGKNSCYFNAENSKIFVGGNVIAGRFHDDTQTTSKVHLYPDGDANTQTISSTNQSLTGLTAATSRNFGFNNQAYNQRIAAMKDVFPATYPQEVQDAINEENKTPDVAIENYLRDRTRKVPFAETTAIPNPVALSGSGDSLRPEDSWTLPVTDGKLTNTTMAVNTAQLPATQPDKVEKDKENGSGDRILVGNNLPYKLWQETDQRFLVGNSISKDVGTNKWEYPTPIADNSLKQRYSQIKSPVDVGLTDRDGFWELMAGTMTQDVTDGMGGLRVVTGAGIYERSNSFLPPPYWDNPTTAGIEAKTTYDDPTTTTKVETYPIVWPDTMPMSPGGIGTQIYNNATGEWQTLAAASSLKGDLQMRATAVYHYAKEPIKDKSDKVLFDNGTDDLRLGYQKPVACISSYYDPTDKNTALNTGTGSRSNNGIVYGPPVARPVAAVTPNATTGLFAAGTNDFLYQQANLVFPNGRFVNELLRNALAKTDEERTLAEKSAIDAESCALGILGKTGYTLGTKPTYISDGAIKEISFLDPRQIKAIHADNTGTTIDETVSLAATNASVDNTKYDQPIEERQPLEIRATQIDLDVLRRALVEAGVKYQSSPDKYRFGTAGAYGPAPEYLLPNSGIVFATRNDALADRSDKNADESSSKLLSSSDFKLDPTRRPNGIVLINGGKLSRNDNQSGDVNTEKGLIMVSNLPTYIRGDFNLHTQEEFKTALDSSWSNFYTRTDINPNFACRPGDSRLPDCTTGDTWRSATVLADAVTLLSDDFRYGLRNEGDFDLNNNSAGAVAIPDFITNKSTTEKNARLGNGFFNNSFAINGLSSDTNIFNGTNYKDIDYSKPNTTLNSSYFNNLVTPVQRRGGSPEYLMEMCLKLPVSACEPQDWITGQDANNDGILQESEQLTASSLVGSGITTTRLGAGTTAVPPLPNYQRFPRRIAVYRNAFGGLELTIPDNYLQVLGIAGTAGATYDPSGTVKEYPYKKVTTAGDDRSSEIPRLVNNSLIYWTTRNGNGAPFSTPDLISLEVDQPLYFYPSDKSPVKKPPLPLISIGTETYFDPNDSNISDYTVCTVNTKGSKNYGVSIEPQDDPNVPQADKACSTEQTEARRFINDVPATTDKTGSTLLWNDATARSIVIDTLGRTSSTADDLTDTNGDGLLIYQLPSTIASTAEDNTSTTDVNEGIVNLTIYANKNQVIIFRLQPDPGLTIGNPGKSSFRIKVAGGTIGNNIFWLSDNKQSIKFENAISATIPHLFLGNIFGDNGGNTKLTLGNYVTIFGRVIGFNGGQETFTKSGNDCSPPIANNKNCLAPGTRVLGMSSPDQPLFVPLLNTYVPGEITAATEVKKLPASAKKANETNWLQRAKSQKYNLILGSHDTPTRSNPKETNGSFENFPRFIELWNGQTAEISGGFYQLGRSKFASAPFAHITGTPNPVQLKTNTNGGFDYTTTFGASGYPGISSFPYYNPPKRKWGYDVGLLAQIPDLFAQKLSTPNPNPNEFFREVGRDDPWVKALLCGKLDTDNDPNTYENTPDVLPTGNEYRPTDCSKYTGS